MSKTVVITSLLTTIILFFLPHKLSAINSDELELSFTRPMTVTNPEYLAVAKKRVELGLEPQITAYNILIDRANSALSFEPDPPEHMEIMGGYEDNSNLGEMRAWLWRNCSNAYTTALAYAYTGEAEFADKTIEILMAWAEKNTSFSGFDRGLQLGSFFSPMLYAADLIYEYAGWDSDQKDLFENWWRNEVLPHVHEVMRKTENNWKDAGVLGVLSAAAVFQDEDLLKEGIGELQKYFEGDWKMHKRSSGADYLPHEVIRIEGSAGINYTAYALTTMTQALEIARFAGVDLWFEKTTGSGASMNGVISQFFRWHILKEWFPWHPDPVRTTVRKNTYELGNYHFNITGLPDWLESDRPVAGRQGDEYTTLNRGLPYTHKTHFSWPEPTTQTGFAFAGDSLTGGRGYREVSVSLPEELLMYATRDEPYVINVIGTIKLEPNIGDYQNINGHYYPGSNTTLRGVGDNAAITGGGFILSGVENILIQNLRFDTSSGNSAQKAAAGQTLPETSSSSLPDYYKTGLMDTELNGGALERAIEMTDGAKRVWITQNTFGCYQKDVLNINGEPTDITLSWNHFECNDTAQSEMLPTIVIGIAEDSVPGPLISGITIHSNYFSSDSRYVVSRYGNVHLFNNYFKESDQPAIVSLNEAGVLVENNFFENVATAWIFEESGEAVGYIAGRNNVFSNGASPETNGTVGEEVFDPFVYYEYAPYEAEEVPLWVMERSGSGREANAEGTTAPLTTRIVLASPSNYAREVGLNPVFNWYEIASASEYAFELYDKDLKILADTVIGTSSLESPVKLHMDQSYIWRVRGIYESGLVTLWSECFEFSTKMAIPEKVLPVLPALKANDVKLQPLFSWDETEHAEKYRFQLYYSNYRLLKDTTLTDNELILPFALDESQFYSWRVKGISVNGLHGPWSDIFEFTTAHASSSEMSMGIPAEFELHANYPNPFNPVTTIRYGVPVRSNVHIRIFDLLGREVKVLVNEVTSPGYYQIDMDAASMASGVYIYRLEAIPEEAETDHRFVQTRKMTLLK